MQYQIIVEASLGSFGIQVPELNIFIAAETEEEAMYLLTEAIQFRHESEE